MSAIATRFLALRAAILLRLRRRREAQRAAEARAKDMIRAFGPEDAHRVIRQYKRKARSRRAAIFWRRVARAAARMARDLPDDETASMMD